MDCNRSGEIIGGAADAGIPKPVRPLHTKLAMPRLRVDRMRLARVRQEYEESPPDHLGTRELALLSDSIRRRIEFLNREIERLEQADQE